MTSLPQLAAEELDVPLASVDIVMGDTDLCPWDMGTFGSLSIRQFGPVLRAAAAEARAVLLQLASERLQVPVGGSDRRRRASSRDNGRREAHASATAQLTAGKRIERRLDRHADARSRSTSFTIVGKSAPRRDAIEKVTGKAKYAGDIVPPGALHARVLRPPAHGATLVSVDTSAAEAVPGVRVVRDGDLVAVLHEHRDEADRALALVKAQFTPSPATLDDTTIFDHLEKTAPAARDGRRGRRRRGRREARHRGVRADLSRRLRRARADGDALGRGGVRERQAHGLGRRTQTPFPVKSQVAQGAEPARRTRSASSRRMSAAASAARARRSRRIEAARLAMIDGKARARRLEPRGGVLLRHVPAGGGHQGAVGPRRRRRRSSFWDYTAIGRRRTRARRTSTTSRTTAPWRAAAGTSTVAGLPAVRRRAVARARQQLEHLRARIAHRHDGGEGRRRPGGVPPEEPDGRADDARAERRGEAVRLDAEAGAERPRRRRRARHSTPAPTSRPWPKSVWTRAPARCRSCASSARRRWASS